MICMYEYIKKSIFWRIRESVHIHKLYIVLTFSRGRAYVLFVVDVIKITNDDSSDVTPPLR